MPEVHEVEVVTGETATAISVPASSLELEVNLENTSVAGTLPVIEAVEIITLGSVKVYEGTGEPTVVNAGNAPALMVLEAADPVPGGTTSGTIILRKP